MLKELLGDQILTNVECKTWKECLEKAGNLLLKNNKIDKSYIEAMENVVKNYGPYMILLPKVCFFHAEPSEKVKETSLSLITLNKDVYFDDFDNEVISCAFAFAAKDRNSHIEFLEKVASLLEDQEFIDLITKNGSKEDIIKKIERL